MVGISVVQLSMMQPSGDELKGVSASGQLFGGFILLSAALFSALAGVSFEKLLKGAQIDLWTRNLQLAFYSLVFGLPGLFLSSDGSRVTREGFFQGYTWLTWTCVLMNACGGLLVGMVIKYANAIVKDIALALSICISSIASPWFATQRRSTGEASVASASRQISSPSRR